jgi:acetylornithine/succinyldiaminopimelate/putrescine aminotransferase
MIKDALGGYYYTTDGKVVLDAISGAYNQPLGHCSEQVKRIVKSSIGNLDTSYREPNESTKALSDSLNAYAYNERYWNFLTTGAEAVEKALMLVPMKYRRIVMFEGAFHGKSFMTAFAHYEHLGWNQAIEIVTIPWMDLDWLEKICFDAVIFEPVQGVGGNIATKEDMLALRKICSDKEAYLVADEVYCGLWRCGDFLVSDIANPDIVVISKGLGGPIPISAVGCLKNEEPLVGWYTTNGNNAFANSVALKMLPLLYNFGLTNKTIELQDWLKGDEHKIKGASFNIRTLKNGFSIKDKLRTEHNIIVGASANYVRLAPCLQIVEEPHSLNYILDKIQECL